MIGWVLGIAATGLLAYEAYVRLVRGGSRPGSGSTVPVATKPSGFEDPPRYLGPDTMHMLKGQRYRMRFLSSQLDPKTLFSSVVVYDLSAKLPTDWPTDPAARTQIDPATHFASGVWSKPTGVVDKPQFLFQVWPTTSSA